MRARHVRTQCDFNDAIDRLNNPIGRKIAAGLNRLILHPQRTILDGDCYAITRFNFNSGAAQGKTRSELPNWRSMHC